MSERESGFIEITERRILRGVLEAAYARIEARYRNQKTLLFSYESWLGSLVTDFETLGIEQLLNRIGPGEDHSDVVLFPGNRNSRVSMVLRYERTSKILYLVFVAVDFESYETEFNFRRRGP